MWLLSVQKPLCNSVVEGHILSEIYLIYCYCGFLQYTPLKSNGIYVRTLVSTGPAAKVRVLFMFRGSNRVFMKDYQDHI